MSKYSSTLFTFFIFISIFIITSSYSTYTPSIILNDNVSNSINSNIPIFKTYALPFGGGGPVAINSYYQDQLPINISIINNTVLNFTAVCSFTTGSTIHYKENITYDLESGVPCGNNYTVESGSFSIFYTNGSTTNLNVQVNNTSTPPNYTGAGSGVASNYNVSSLVNNASATQNPQYISQAYSNIFNQVISGATNSYTTAVSSQSSLVPQIPIQPVTIILPAQTLDIPLKNGVQLIITMPPITEQMNVSSALESAFQSSMQSSINTAVQASMSTMEPELQSSIETALQSSLGNGQTTSGLASEISGSIAQSLSSTIETEIYSSLSNNIGGTITTQTIPTLESNAESSIASSFTSSLDTSIYQAIYAAEPTMSSGAIQSLTSSIVASVSTSTISSLNTVIYSVLNQNTGAQITPSILNQISSSISTSILSTTSGYIGSYINTNEQTILSQLPTSIQSQPFGSTLSSAISSSVSSALQGSFQNLFGNGFQSSLQSGLQSGLSSLPSSLPGQLTNQEVQSLSSSLSSSLSQSMSQELASSLSSSLSQSLAQSLSQDISQSLSQSISQSLSQSISQSFSQAFANNFAQSFSSAMSQSISQSLAQNLLNTVPQQLSSAFTSSLSQELASSIGTTEAQQFSSDIQSGIEQSISSALYQGFSQGFEQNIQNSIFTNLQTNVGQQLQGDMYQSMNSYISQQLPQTISSTLTSSLYQSLNNNLQNSLTQTVSQDIQQSLQSSLSSALSQQLSGNIGSTLTSSITSAISYSVASSVSSALQQGLANGLSQSMGEALGQSLSSSLYNSFSTSFPPVISSSLSSTLSSYIGPSISSSLGPSLGSAIDSSLSTSLQSSIYSGFSNGFSSTLPYAMASTFGNSFSSSLTYNLENAINYAIGSSIAGSLPPSISYAISQTISSNVDNIVNTVGTGISTASFSSATLSSIGNGISLSIGQAIPSIISSSVSTELSNYLPQAISTSVGNAAAVIIPNVVSSAISGTFGNAWTGTSATLTTALGTALKSEVGTYLGGAVQSSISGAFSGDWTQSLSNYLMGSLSSSLKSLLGNSAYKALSTAYNVYNAYESYSSSYSSSSSSMYSSLASTSWLSVWGVLSTGKLPLVDSFTTTYSGNNNKISTTQSTAQALSPVSKVNADNANNAKTFLTCPTSISNGVTTSQVFTNSGSFVGGNQCLNPVSSLNTEIVINTSIHDRFYVPFSTVDNIQIINPGFTIPTVLSYSPEVDGELSNGFSTQSYIFQSVPSFEQKALWVWSSPYANFANAKSSSATYTNAYQFLILGVCNYQFTYSVTTKLDWIKNINIPFEYLGQNGAKYNIGTPILPDLNYVFNISLKNQNGYAEPNLTNLKYSIFSPYHYYNPQNTLEPFPIDTQSAFLAAYNSMGSSPYNSVEFNRSGEGIDTNTNNALSFMSANDQLISIASLPNDYIYVLYLNKTNAGSISLVSQQGNYNNDYAANNNTNVSNNTSNNTILFTPNSTVIGNLIYTTSNEDNSNSIKFTHTESFAQSSTPIISAIYNPTTGVIAVTGSGFTPPLNNGIFAPSYSLSYQIYPDVNGHAGSGVSAVQTGNPYPTTSYIDSSGNLALNINLQSSLTNFPYLLQVTESISTPSSLQDINSNYVVISKQPAIEATYTAGLKNYISVQGSGFTPNNAVTVAYLIALPGISGGQLPGAPAVYGTQIVTSDSNGNIAATLPVYASSQSYVAVVYASDSYTKTVSNKVNLNIIAQSTATKVLGTYDIAVFRVYNNTYYNQTQPLPSASISCSSESSCQSTWNSEWQNYWSSLIASGTGNIRQVGNIPLGFYDVVNPPVNYRTFTPYNISLDYQGDLFMITTETLNGNSNSLIMKYQNKNDVSPTANTLNTLTCVSISCFIPSFNYQNDISTNSFTEIAVSPNGGQVYLATPSQGQIYIYNGNDLTYSSAINLGFYDGAVSSSSPSQLSSSPIGTPALASLNIYYWLSNNGLYNQSISGLSNFNVNPTYDYDKDAFHRPLAIRDINGYLYVLDNWAGIIGAQTTGSSETSSIFGSPDQGIYFNMLMLRVINSTGYDVPIQPTLFNDMFQQQTCQIANPSQASECFTNNPPTNYCVQPSASTGASCIPYPVTSALSQLECAPSTVYNNQYAYQFICATSGSLTTSPSSTYYQTSSANLYPTNTYPPYGWILSARVEGLNNGKSSTSLNLYGNAKYSNSAYNPQSPTGSSGRWDLGSYNSEEGYYPVGPQMPDLECTGHSTSAWSNFLNSFTSVFKGNSCTVPQLEGVGFSVNYNNTIALLMDGGSGNPSAGIAAFGYGELLISRFNIFNYTKIGGGVVYTCYSGYNVSSYISKNGPCQYTPQLFGSGSSGDPNIPILSPPIYLANNPFNYYESLGAQKIFQYANNLYSTYSSGKGSPSTIASNNYNQNCINQVTNGLEPTDCINSPFPTSIPLSNIASGISSIGVSLQTAPSVPILESSISGLSIIPYAYQVSMNESWKNFQLRAGLYFCPESLPPIYYGDSSIHYGYVSTATEVSPTLSAPIEGGKSYLSYENTYSSGYYVPNLSDVGVFLSPQIFFNISSNRLFGSVYVNTTQNINTNKQFLLNATEQLNYIINFNKIGSNMQIETISSTPVDKTGPSAAVGLSSPQTQPIPTGISYTPELLGPPGIGAVNLFNWYQQIVYESPLKFYINGSYGTLPYGYHRLIYVLQDRFNNTIYAPIDADIARLTTINLTTNPIIDPSNANQTTLEINGTAGFYVFNALGENFYPLSNGYVYLYYDQNLDYNGINPLQQGTNGAFDAQLCAYGVSSAKGYPSSCVVANPLNGSEAQSGNIITYAPQFSSNGECLTPQQSIVNVQTPDCNIYTNALCPTGNYGQHEYCYPIDNNGDGFCTSQLGLMDIAKTNSTGAFSFNTVACGIGQEQIIAKYYGYPAPEPVQAQQSLLPYSADPTTNQPSIKFFVYNYSWMPNQTISAIQIGLFELSYGTITLYGIVILLLFVATVLVVRYKLSKNSRVSKNANKNSNKKKQKSKTAKKSLKTKG